MYVSHVSQKKSYTSFFHEHSLCGRNHNVKIKNDCNDECKNVNFELLIIIIDVKLKQYLNIEFDNGLIRLADVYHDLLIHARINSIRNIKHTTIIEQVNSGLILQVSNFRFIQFFNPFLIINNSVIYRFIRTQYIFLLIHPNIVL